MVISLIFLFEEIHCATFFKYLKDEHLKAPYGSCFKVYGKTEY
jgi:hypothetical protein